MRHKLRLADLPLTDITGQRYACVGLRHRKSRGKPTSPFAIVETRCFDCGTAFHKLVYANAEFFIPVRRCREHRRPGVPARAAKPPAEPATAKRLAAEQRARNVHARSKKAALTDGLGAFG